MVLRGNHLWRSLGHTSSLICVLLFSLVSIAQDFTAFESQQFTPMAISPDGSRLFVANTPDNRLEILSVSAGGLKPVASVQVGLEPVSVAVRNNSEVWVVNHLSDSVSIVDVSNDNPRVTRTLLVGDEPRDIVFAGAGNSRAFITAAHRGQNSPYNDPENPAEATTPGIGRADVWVFDATNPGAEFGGTALEILSLFGDSPGALTVSPDGATVYAAVFKSGNQTTALAEGLVCDGGASAAPCETVPGELESPGGLPAPNEDSNGVPQPEVGLIVKYDGSAWRDELGRDWSNQVRFDLPDLDVFAIDALATTPLELQAFPSVGTVLYGMKVNPATGKLYVANTDAQNHIRFAGARPGGNGFTTVQGSFSQARITIIDPSTAAVSPRHLNKHIDYDVRPAPASVRDASLSLPAAMAITSDGSTLYLAAKGSGKIGIFSTTQLDNDSFIPNSADHIQLTGGGPTGLILDEPRDRLYILTRFDNTVSVVDTIAEAEVQRLPLFNPEPESIVSGRQYLYDATTTSSNGEVSCASCHISGDKDELAWDLGDPLGTVLHNPNPFKDEPEPTDEPDFHPIKGPMLTQTLRGLTAHGPLHFRGDMTAGNDPGGDPMDVEAGFMKIAAAYVDLLGRDAPLPEEDMQELIDFVMQLTPPPNPIRNLDFITLTPAQSRGVAYYGSDPMACGHCHRIRPALNQFGTFGKSEMMIGQAFKISHLRNMYERVGMFGMPETDIIYPGDHEHMGDQIRGYGYLHDGSQDTLFRYNRLKNLVFFSAPETGLHTEAQRDAARRDVEQFMLVTATDMKPVVGQQVTLSAASDAAAHARVDLIVSRAAVGDADLVVKAEIAGVERGWYMSAIDTFTSDRLAEAPLTEAQLRSLADVGSQALTYTAVPPGSGNRIGVDRDRDGVLDGDDNCPAVANPLQEDSDGDSIGDACPIVLLLSDALIDISPSDPTNYVNTSGGFSDKMFVSIEGRSDFDVTQVDASSIRFGPAEASAHTLPPEVRDTNGDGFDDLYVKFRVGATGLSCGYDDDVFLFGETYSGLEFEGSDFVVTDECETLSCHP
jgi:YVTN family beta-propeller protein